MGRTNISVIVGEEGEPLQTEKKCMGKEIYKETKFSRPNSNMG